jgi:homoserine kinase type II
VETRLANELFELAERLAAEACTLRDRLEVEFVSSQLADVVRADYDLGEVLGVEQILGGYTNLSFAVHTRDGAGEHRFFVRKYNRSITEREIRFEHALVRHISAKGFHIAARVFPNKHGGTFVTREETQGGERVTRFFAVYEMLTGEDKYTWVKNRCTDKEYENGGRVLAEFHYLAHDFDPGDLGRQQPPIFPFLRDLRSSFAGYAAQHRDTPCGRYFEEWLPVIDEQLRKGIELEPQLEGMPYIPVHCDYHPGNLKWVDEQGVGLFDFDWSKLDYRLFDVAEGIVYFCSSWEGRDSGDLLLDKTELFLRGYQEEASRFAYPGPLSEAELRALSRMIANANLYVLNWDASAYYEAGEVLADQTLDEDDEDEYLMYLKHQVQLMDYIERHQEELAELAMSLAPAASAHTGGAEEGA